MSEASLCNCFLTQQSKKNFSPKYNTHKLPKHRTKITMLITITYHRAVITGSRFHMANKMQHDGKITATQTNRNVEEDMAKVCSPTLSSRWPTARNSPKLL